MNRNVIFAIFAVVVVAAAVGTYLVLRFVFVDEPKQGLDIEPKVAPDERFINYKMTNTSSIEPYTEALTRWIESYNDPETSGNLVHCDSDHPPAPGSSCDVDFRNLGPCAPENSFGFKQSRPCIFLTWKRVKDWVPVPYNISEELPETMPFYLKEYIARQKKHDKVWVSCDGIDSADQEFLGPIQYLPNWGFPFYYFPYTNQTGYLDPVIAVHFERPALGVVIKVACKAWARNIKDELGEVVFDILIDP